MGGRLLAGVDVGGSKIAVLLADRDLAPVHRHEVETGAGDGITPVERIATAVEDALRGADRRAVELAAIGVGVPGRVDPVAGTVTLAVNLGWHDVDLAGALGSRFGVPVAVENDVRAAAAWLHARAGGDPADDIAYLAVGTGIAAGVVIDGRVHRGRRGLAGEIGHVVIERDGPACRCGLRGCLEAVASGRAIAAIATEALDTADTTDGVGRGGHAPDLDVRPLTAASVYRAAAAGDPLACRVIEDAGRFLARAVHELVMAYDVRRVVLGGGVSRAGAPFLAPVVRGLDELRDRSPLAREALPDDLLELLPPDADPGCWGAIFLARSAASPPGHLEGGGDGASASP